MVCRPWISNSPHFSFQSCTPHVVQRAHTMPHWIYHVVNVGATYQQQVSMDTAAPKNTGPTVRVPEPSQSSCRTLNHHHRHPKTPAKARLASRQTHLQATVPCEPTRPSRHAHVPGSACDLQSGMWYGVTTEEYSHNDTWNDNQHTACSESSHTKHQTEKKGTSRPAMTAQAHPCIAPFAVMQHDSGNSTTKKAPAEQRILGNRGALHTTASAASCMLTQDTNQPAVSISSLAGRAGLLPKWLAQGVG